MDVLESAIKTVESLQECERDLALTCPSRLSLVSFDALAIIVEVSERSQVQIVLLTQLFFELIDIQRLIAAIRLLVFLRCFHSRIGFVVRPSGGSSYVTT